MDISKKPEVALFASRPCKFCGHSLESPVKKCPQCGGKNPYSFKKNEIIVMVAVGALLVSCCTGLSMLGEYMKKNNSNVNLESGSTSPKSSDSNIKVLRASDGGGVPVALNQAAYNRMTEFVAANDKVGFGNMILSGLVWDVPSGTKIRVINPGFISSEVRILEGKHMNRLCIVPAHCLSNN